MGILVTPKSQAEVNQLVSVLHSAGYKHFESGDLWSDAKSFNVGKPAVIFETTNDYCYHATQDTIDYYINDNSDCVLSVNELGQYLQGN